MEQIEQLKEQLKKQEKLASLGLLSAGIAHEIQNPLNFVINFSKMSEKLLNDLTEIVDNNKDKFKEDNLEDLEDIMADLQENLAKIAEHSERAINIIQGILLVSRGKEGAFHPTNVAEIVKEYVWLSYHAMRAKNKGFNVSIHEEYEQGLPTTMSIPQDLSRAVLNLTNNALYAVWEKQQKSGEGYNPEISVKVYVQKNDICVSIADNGVGMTEEVKQRLYENFFTTKPIGEGTGLGMGITRDIIEDNHGGRLTFESQENLGSTFSFFIPIKKK